MGILGFDRAGTCAERSRDPSPEAAHLLPRMPDRSPAPSGPSCLPASALHGVGTRPSPTQRQELSKGADGGGIPVRRG